MAEGRTSRPPRVSKHIRDATPRRRRARSWLGLAVVVGFTGLAVAAMVAAVILVLVVAANRVIG